jgi:hypothetical protein
MAGFSRYRQTFLLALCLITVFVLYQQNVRLAQQEPSITVNIKGTCKQLQFIKLKGDIPIDLLPAKTEMVVHTQPLEGFKEEEETSQTEIEYSKSPISIVTLRNIVWLVEGSPVPNCEVIHISIFC